MPGGERGAGSYSYEHLGSPGSSSLSVPPHKGGEAMLGRGSPRLAISLPHLPLPLTSGHSPTLPAFRGSKQVPCSGLGMHRAALEAGVAASSWAFPVGPGFPASLSCALAAVLLAHSHTQILPWPLVATPLQSPRGPAGPACFLFSSVHGNRSVCWDRLRTGFPRLSAPASCRELS